MFALMFVDLNVLTITIDFLSSALASVPLLFSLIPSGSQDWAGDLIREVQFDKRGVV